MPDTPKIGLKKSLFRELRKSGGRGHRSVNSDARLTTIQENTPEALLLNIGRALNEAGVTKEEALRVLERARRKIYG